jgi:ADP-ribose pyrophosphatase
MNDIRIVSKKRLITSPYLDVVETTLEKDGKEHVHINVEQKTAVFILPVTEQGEVYMVSQFRYLLQREMTEVVAGMVDKDEDPLEAAKRELQEETGLRASKWTDLGEVWRGASFVKGKYHFFLAQQLTQGEQKLDEFEKIAIQKIPLDEALANLFSPDSNTSGTVISLLLLDKMRRENRL